MKKRLHGDDLLTRAELAKAIGKSKTTIRRWETTGKLKPIVDEHGVHLFRMEDAQRLNGGEPIQALPRARAYVASADRANGELGAQVFDLLLKKTPHVKIVTELRIHPTVLEGFLDAWARLRHGYVVNGRQLRAITSALNVITKSGDDLVKVITRIQERRERCRNCRKAPPTWCYACVSQRVEQQLKDRGMDITTRVHRNDEDADDEQPADDDSS